MVRAPIEEAFRAGFEAGFAASAEGFNGEYAIEPEAALQVLVDHATAAYMAEGMRVKATAEAMSAEVQLHVHVENGYVLIEQPQADGGKRWRVVRETAKATAEPYDPVFQED